jgi:hypothetical protein
MKRLLIFILLPLTFAFAEDPAKALLNLYQKGAYKEACQYGLRYFNRYKKNNDYVMLYAFSCLKADYIDRLAVPLTALRYTPEERNNATYFATILLQKKLLYHSILDHTDISGIRLPVTDFVLSIVFDLYTKKAYKKVDGVYHFVNPTDPHKTYTLYSKPSGRAQVVVIDEYVDNQLVQSHQYW